MTDHIRSVPVMVAATKCWLARPEPPNFGGPLHRIESGHVDPCRFCDFRTDFLHMLILEAQSWIEFNNNAPMLDFEKLPVAEQRRLVAAAAAIPDSLASIPD